MVRMTPEEFRSLFPGLRLAPEELIVAILRRSEPVSLKSGAMVYEEGGPCRSIGFVLAGEVRVFKAGPNDREIALYEVLPGETCILNAACIFARRLYPANARVVEDVRALILPDRAFLELTSEHESLRQFVFRLFAERFALIIELVDEIVFHRLDQRLADFLLKKAQDDLVALSQKDIAKELGSSREVIGRLLKDFEHKGMIRRERNRIMLTGLAPGS